MADSAKSRTPSAAEVGLAEQIVETLTGDFDPRRWQNDHRERLTRLIEAKSKGARLKIVQPKPKEATGDLARSLRASLAATGGKKVA